MFKHRKLLLIFISPTVTSNIACILMLLKSLYSSKKRCANPSLVQQWQRHLHNQSASNHFVKVFLPTFLPLPYKLLRRSNHHSGQNFCSKFYKAIIVYTVIPGNIPKLNIAASEISSSALSSPIQSQWMDC